MSEVLELAFLGKGIALKIRELNDVVNVDCCYVNVGDFPYPTTRSPVHFHVSDSYIIDEVVDEKIKYDLENPNFDPNEFIEQLIHPKGKHEGSY